MRTRYFFSVLVLAAVFSACQKEVKQSSVTSGDASNANEANQILVTSSPPSSAKNVKTMDPVTISATGYSALGFSIDIKVTAGKSGAPSGFVIQWVPAAVLATYTGPVDNAGWPLDATVFCSASLSGNASNSRYALKKGQSVTVSIGNLLLDNGASTSCPGNLGCDTEYAFRAFANADGSVIKSPWSNILHALTLPGNCGAGGI